MVRNTTLPGSFRLSASASANPIVVGITSEASVHSTLFHSAVRAVSSCVNRVM